MTACMLAIALSLISQSQTVDSPVGAALRAIEEATIASLRNWEVRIESGTNEENVDQRPWNPARLTHSTKEYRLRYRSEVRIPEVFAGTGIGSGRAELMLYISGPYDFKAEVFINGRLEMTLPDEDAGAGPQGLPRILLSESARAGETFDIEIAVFNPLIYPPHEFLDTSRRVNFRGAYLMLEAAEAMRSELLEFAVNLDAGNRLLQPWRPSPSDERVVWPERVNRSRIPVRQRRRLRDILREAAARFDLQALKAGDSEKVRASIKTVLEHLQPVSKFAKSFTIYLVGNAHIDLAWLWRTRESVRISANTFRSVLNNMADFPELTYAQSQAQAYRWVEQADPELFSRIQESVRSGNWDVVGGMWVEPDCNLIGGESWVRQILYAQRFFQEKFGTTAWLGWNPDSFGYNWNMPQIYSKAGIRAFITQKIHWNDTTAFPHHLFWWEAPDGSRILTYFPPGSYTERIQPDRMVEQLMRFEHCTGFREVLVLFGIGNHGGGPNVEMLERARMLQRQPVFPKVEFTRAHDFIDRLMQRDLSGLPVWRSELYLEQHRGTLTTQSETKRSNRKCEALLETAEKAASIASLLGAPYPQDELERAWKLVLLNQFHDILPGSSITPVYRDAEETYALARKLAKRSLDGALDAVAARTRNPGEGWRSVLVFNPLSWERNEPVRVALPANAPERITVKDPDGEALPGQIIPSEDGLGRELLFIARGVPSVGYKLFTLHEGGGGEPDSDLEAEGLALENRFLRVEVDAESGNISRIFDKLNGREVLPEGKRGNGLELHENIPSYWDAWNIGYTGRSWTLDRADSVELIESGPARAVIRVKKSFMGLSKANRAPTEGFPSSFFTQDIILYAGSPRLDVTLRTDWWEDHTLLKVSFPFNVENGVATYEIPFGSIERPTVREEPWQKARFEVAVHRWADLSGGDYGVSLLNDGKYGMDTLGNVMRLTIHTSPLWPDPLADRGKHVCTYSIYPHAGDWREAQTAMRARELNLPLVYRFVSHGDGDLPPSGSFFGVSGEGVVLTTLKRAEDSDALILRLVETRGREAEVTVQLPASVESATEVDLLEREIGKVSLDGHRLTLTLKPNEFKSVKFK